PLQFKPGENAQSLCLTGRETYDIVGIAAGAGQVVTVTATPDAGKPIQFEARVRHFGESVSA
ncbi:MAG: hypothetical protein H7062_03685, partial [Candidatus Saccharimonas sp.]|nr:hypothetical protein [Planctomycetaceae bacterium]